MSKVNKTKRGARAASASTHAAAMEETLKLYHAWLGYLLTLRGEGELRVRAEDIRAALGCFSCTVAKEGDEYVIRVQTRETAHGG